MDNEHSAFCYEESTNRLKKILSESKGKVLDEALLRKIEIELEKRNSKIVELLKNAETYKRLEDKINQLTETQQRLIISEKLAAIGSMSSYIAHEIRNPLVTIGGFAKSLSCFNFEDSRVKANIEIIYDEVRRLEKIFDPFFTTKASGTGIGMAISLKIIEDHGGNIKVKSECGKGTTITISLEKGVVSHDYYSSCRG
jgi:signal transduction histidine kinase